MKLLLIFLAVAPAMLLADQLVLKNGDRVTGQITKKDGAKVTVKTELMGEVTITWDAVTSVTSGEPLTVTLADGKTIVGTVETADGSLRVTTPASVATAPLPQVAAIRDAAEQKTYERMLSPGWLDLWAGHFDFSLATARGNAKTNSTNTAFSAARITRTDKTTLYFNQIEASATIDGKHTTTANAVRGGWTFDRNVSSRLFINTFNDYEYDNFQNLDLRFTLGGGLGFSAVKKESTRLDFVAGADFEHESFSTPLTRNRIEMYAGNDFTRKLFARSSVHQSFRIFKSVSDGGTYRMNFDLSAETALWKWLAWQASASDRFLSAPVSGRQKNDLLLTTGFRINFAR